MTPSFTSIQRFRSHAQLWVFTAILLPLAAWAQTDPVPPSYGLRLWLDAGTGVAADGNGVISQWVDQSANGHLATQGAVGSRPTLVANALNGQPVVRFDGTSDYLALTNFMVNAEAGEVFIVLKSQTDQGADRGLWRMSATSVGNEGYSWYPWGNGNIEESFGRTSSTVLVPKPPVPLTAAHIHNVASSNGSYTVRQNGIIVYSSASSTFGFRTNPILGLGSNYYGERYYYGDIAEMIVYERLLVETEREEVELYLTRKYGLATAPTIVTPVKAVATSNSSVTIAWGLSQREDSVFYTIERRSGGGEWSKIGESRSLSFVDAGLSASTQYEYRVRMVAGGEIGDPSAEVSVATMASSVGQISGEGLRYWLDAGSVSPAANGEITVWPNRASAVRGAVQNAATTRPLLIADALNGQPVVRFDGVNDYFGLPDFMASTNAAEIFIVLRSRTDSGANRGLWRMSAANVPNEGYNWYPWSDGNIEESFGRSLSTVLVPNPPVPLTTTHIHNVASAGDSYVVRQNGAVVYSTLSNTYGFRSNPILGLGSNYYGDRYFFGDIAEMIVYERVLSDFERESVQIYLGRKYGLAPAPTVVAGVKAIGTSETTVTISWGLSQRDDPVSYIVERSPGGEVWSMVGESRSLSYVDSGLVPDTEYYYRVRMVAGGEPGGPSIEVPVRTMATAVAILTQEGMRLWLDAGSISPTANQEVAIWPNRVSGVLGAVQNAASTRPLLIADGLNGQPVVRFDGVNDYFGLSNFMAGASAGEVFIVLKSGTDSGANRGLWRMSATIVANEGYSWYPWSDGKVEESFGRANSTVLVPNPPVALTTPHIHNVASESGTYIVRQNGVVVFSTLNNTYGFRTNPILGLGSNYYGDRYYFGDIAEVIVYDRVLTDSQRASVQIYLARKYGLSPPPTIVSQVRVVSTSNTTVTVSWTSPQRDDPVSYIIERRSGSGEWATVGSSTSFSYVDVGLDTASEYEYRIRMVAGGEVGTASEALLVRTMASEVGAITESGMRWWLDAGSISPAPNGEVAVWPNRVSGVQDTVQNTAGTRPLLVADGLNGQPVVRFDGINDYFGLSDFMTGTVAAEVFIVLKSGTDSGANRGLWRMSAPNVQNEGYSWYPWSDGNIEESFGRANNTVSISNPPVPLTTTHIHNVASVDGSYIVRQNSTIVHSTGANTYGFRTNPILGLGSNYYGDRYYYGDMAEMMVYDRVLSDSERQSVRFYLYRKYNFGLEALSFFPSAGFYGAPIQVEIASPSPDAQIYYTVDGSAPVYGVSAMYDTPIAVSQSTQIRAQAFVSGSSTSNESSSFYAVGAPSQPITASSGLLGEYFQGPEFTESSTRRIDVGLNNPSFTTLPAEWQVNTASTRWTGELIARFTEDHSFTLKTNGGVRLWLGNELLIDDWAGTTSREHNFTRPLISGTRYPVRVEYQRKVAAVELTWEWSGFSTPRKIIPRSQFASGLPYGTIASTPVVTPPEGIYADVVNLSLEATVPAAEAQIRYTLDGSDPTESSILYIGAFPLTEDTLVKARTYAPNYTESGLRIAHYRPSAAAFSTPAAYHKIEVGHSSSGYGTLTELAFEVAGNIYYLDTSTVTATAAVIHGSLPQLTDTNINNYPVGLAVGGAYIIITPGPIEIAAILAACQKNYNGSYNLPPYIKYYTSSDEGLTWDLLMTASNITWPTGYKRLPISRPGVEFSPPSGLYSSTLSVELSSTLSDSNIYYTTDGSEPVASGSLLYTDPIFVSASTLIRARAYNASTHGLEGSALYRLGNAPESVTPLSGLSAEYFQGPGFSGSSTRRIEAQINNPNIATLPVGPWTSTSLSARYVGELIAQFTEDHMFSLKTNGGVRLWIGEELIIDDWSGAGSRTLTSVRSLVAGARYPLRLEFQRNSSASVELKLEWEGFSTARQVVPQSQFSSGLTYSDINATPEATPPAGVYGENVTVELLPTSPASGVRLHYTLDSSDPTASSALYISPLTFHQAVTLKARAYSNNYTHSGVLVASYTIDNVAPELSSLTFNGGAVPATITTNGIFGITAVDSSGVKRVDFALDGVLIASDAVGADGFTAPFTIEAVTDGPHVLTIQAWDMADIASEVFTANLVVALPPPPPPAITAPTNNQKVNQSAFTVRGTAQKNAAIVVYRGDTQIGTTVAAADGTFSVPIALTAGDNDLSATAANRNPLPSERSASVRIVFDNTVPAPPTGLTARSRSAGQILVEWNSPLSGLANGYYVFRSSSPIPADAPLTPTSALGGALQYGLSFTDTPPTDGRYYYRVATGYAVGSDVTVSVLSNQADAVSDRVPPTATVSLEPLGSLYDATQRRYGRGLVRATLTTSEPLAGIPFLNLATSGGSTFFVDLSPQGETAYTGVFTIAAASRSGAVNPVLSAIDVAGNRGTLITLEDTAIVDTHAPEVTGLSVVSVSETGVISEAPAFITIKNEPVLPATAVTLHWVATLDEAPKPGTIPEFTGTLSDHAGLVMPLAISDANDADAGTWLIELTLPADAGAESETLTLNFAATDDLDNSGSVFGPPHSFQVYMGDLPPVQTPQNFTAEALPAGAIRLNWSLVNGASAYVLQARGPADTDFLDLETVTAVSSTHTYTPIADGLYTYRIASVRMANDQDATSGWSEPASARADRLPPSVPTNLVVSVIAQGVKATWDAPAVSTDVAGYALYRSSSVINSVDGLTAAIGNIPAIALLAVDAQPAGSAPHYGLVARDAAGNLSAPATAFANVTLLPVATLSAVRVDNAAPFVSWTLPSGSVVDGYTLAIDDVPTLVNGNLLIPASQQSYSDATYTTGDRLYGLKTVSGPDSRERTLLLQDLSLTLADAELKRGLMNTLGVVVRNLSSTALTDASLKVRVANRDHAAANPVSLAPGEEAIVPVVVGGYDDLSAASVSATISVTTNPHPGETATVTRTRTATVVEGALTPEILPGEFIRGGHGQVKFKLTNPSSQPIELKVARAQGTQASDEVRFKLLDAQGATLSTTAVQIALGENIVALPGGTTVVRIPAGGSYTSPTIELPLPAAAPALVTVTLEIDSVYFNLGVAGTQVKLNGPRAQVQVSTIESSYSAQISSATPDLSNGSEPVVISGRALWRGVDPLSPTAGATFVPVVISIRNQGFIRRETKTTDATGNFTYSFQPGATETGGVYEVWASHPDALTPPEELTTFVVRRVLVTPTTFNVRTPRNYRQALPVQVSTGAGTTVQNLRAELIGVLPADVVCETTPIATINGQQTVALPFSVMGLSATAESLPSGSFQYRVVSDDGSGGEFVWATLTVNYEFTEARPVIQSTPSHLQIGVQSGQTAAESIVLKNQGYAPLDGATLSLVPTGDSPLPSWVTLQTPANVGTFDVGQSLSVRVAAVAPVDSGLIQISYTGYLRVSGTNATPVDFPVTVTLSPEGKGSAVFKIVDPYFQLTFADNAPNASFNGVVNASVVLENETSTGVPSVTKAGRSDANGEINFSDIPAGRYKLRISADKHEPYISRVTIKPGILYTEQVQLTYTPVTFTWEVVPVTFQDVYNVVLTATFETNVPVPVLVVEPGVINLPKMCAGQVYSGEFRITNHGLIDAEGVEIPTPPSDEYYAYEFMVGFGDKIKAGQTVTVAYKVKCLKALPGECPDELAETGTLDFAKSAAHASVGQSDLSFGNAACFTYSVPVHTKYYYICANELRFLGWRTSYIVKTYGTCGGTGSSSTPPAWTSNPNPGGTPTGTGPGGFGPGGGTTTGGSFDECFVQPPPPKDPCDERLSPAGSAVDLASRQFVDTVQDLIVPVPGGSIPFSREYSSRRWRFLLTDDLYALHGAGSDRYSLVLNGAEYHPTSAASTYGTEITSAASASVGSYLNRGIGPEKITKNTDGTFIWTDGKGASRNYDSAGRLLTLRQTGNLVGTFHYTTEGALSHVTDRDERTVLTPTYVDGSLTQATDFSGRSVNFTYDVAGRLETVTDRLGTLTKYTYDDAWHLIGKRVHLAGSPDASDHIETMAYHRYSTVETGLPPVRVIAGHPIFGDKIRGQVMSVEHNFGARRSYEFNFDASLRTYRAREVTAGGRDIEKVFNASGRLIAKSINGTPVRRVEQAERTRVITEGGQITTEELDERDNVTRRTLPDGAIERFEYNLTVNKLARYTDPLGVVTTYTYDALGNQLTKTEAVGTALERVTTSEYYAGTSLLKQRTMPSLDATAYTYDSSDRLVRIYDPADPVRQTTYTYDEYGNRATETDALGRVTTWRYDAEGRLEEEINPLGESTVYTYVGPRLMEIETGKAASAAGRKTRYGYDAGGRKTKEMRVDAAGVEHLFKTFSYDADGNILSETNALGQSTSYGYDASGNQASVTRLDADGNNSVTGTSYDAFNRPTQVTDAVGIKRSTQYDVRGRLSILTEAVGTNVERSTQNRYDLAGRSIEVKQTDAREPTRVYTTTYTYDALGRRTALGGDRVYSKATTYDANDRILSETDALGRIASFEYDATGRPALIRLNGVTLASYAYDLVGNRITVTDGVGNHHHYRYDKLNRVIHESIPLLGTQSIPSEWWTQKAYVLQETAYNAFGEVTARTRYTVGESGTSEATSSATYDAFGRKSTDTDPAGLTRSFTYDAADNLVTVSFPPVASSGSTQASSITYLRSPNNCELVDAVVDRAGNTTHFTYDNALRQIEETNSLNGVTVRTFDPLGRVATLTYPSSNTTSYEYDRFDQLVKVTYPDHVPVTHERVETLRYDSRGKLVEKAGAGGYPLTYGYDAVGNLTTMTDANQRTTEWAYTSLNQVTIKRYADGTSHHYTYDAAGRLITRQDALNRVTAYGYNAYSVPVLIDYPADTDVVFGYDQQGRRLHMVDGSGTTTWTYDAAGRPLTETQGRSGRTLNFGYDGFNQRTDLQVTGGASPWTTTYGYDNAGRLKTVLDDRIAAGQPFVYGYTSNANLVAQIIAPGGVKTTKNYDTQGRLMSIAAFHPQLSTLSSLSYTYDTAGQRNTETSLERTRAFSYDAYRELTESVATAPDSQLTVTDSYAYDGIGNRLTSSLSTPNTQLSTSYTANSVNQYALLTGTLADIPAYDPNGNTTFLRGKTLHYDDENRLVEVSDVVRSVVYIYDGFGRRVERIDYPLDGPATATRYIYDGWRSLEEVDAIGATVRSYTRGLDLSGTFDGAGGIGGLLGISSPSSGSWTTASYYYDGNGNVTGLLDSTGNVVAHYTYSPFGERLTAIGMLADTNPYQFSSKERDALTGWYYYGYRYYEPMTGRWLNRDPLGERESPNEYGVLMNNTIGHYDLNGLYGEAGHFYTTFLVATAAGYSEDAAYHLAYYSQYPDENSAFSAIGSMKKDGLWADVQNYLHSLSGGDAEKRRKYIECLLKSGKFNEEEKGLLIHALGDAYAHSYAETARRPGRSGQTYNTGKQLLYSTGIGHAIAGHTPDFIGNYAGKYNSYVDQLYQTLSSQPQASGAPNPAMIEGLKAAASGFHSSGLRDYFGAPPDGQNIYEANELRDLPGGYKGDYRPELGDRFDDTKQHLSIKFRTDLVGKIKNGVEGCCPPK